MTSLLLLALLSLSLSPVSSTVSLLADRSSLAPFVTFSNQSDVVQVFYHAEATLHSKIFSRISDQLALDAAEKDSDSAPDLESKGESATPPLTDLECFYGKLPKESRVQALVASGKSLNDMGNYQMCNKADGAQYCVATVGYNNLTVTGIKLGLCVAKDCSSDNVSVVVQDYINSLATVVDQYIYLDEASVHCPEPAEPLRPGFFIAVVWYAILAILCVAGTWLKWDAPPAPAKKPKSQSQITNGDLAERLVDVAKQGDDDDEPPEEKKREPSCCAKIVMAFDMNTNWKKLMLPSVDDRLECLNGVRALSMFWIIYGHTFFNALQENFKNSMYMLPPDGYTAGYAFLMVPGGYFAVDSFFWLGGFLVVFHLLNEIKKKGRGPPLYILYIFRFIRIVPTYLFFLLFFVGVLVTLGDGPLWYEIANHTGKCTTSWWANMLFVNNFLPVDDTKACMDWSWYLADDMQFFLVTPFLIWIYHKSKVAGFVVCGTILAIATGITAWLVIGGTKMPDGSVLPADLSSSSLSVNNPYFVKEVYLKPYCRIQSYIIGIMTGFVNDIYGWRANPKRKINIFVDLIVAGLAAALCWVCIFGEQGQYSQLDSPWSQTMNVVYNSVTKIVFSIGLAVICMLCVTGNARFFNWFLTLWIWNPLARLTFGAYLVHPIIMDLFYSSTRVVFYWDNYFMPVHFVFFVVTAYLMSGIQFMLLERPMMSLTNLLKGAFLGGKKKKKRRKEGDVDAEAPAPSGE